MIKLRNKIQFRREVSLYYFCLHRINLQKTLFAGADRDPEDSEDGSGEEEVQAEVRDVDEDQPALRSAPEAWIHGEKPQNREGKGQRP